MENKLTISLTRYGESDELAQKCLASLSKQKDVTARVMFLDQKSSNELKNFCKKISNDKIVIEYIIIPAKSLSYARNFAIGNSNTNILAYCDSDCILPENWAYEIINTFNLTGASIIGTKIVPLWENKPSWYHQSNLIKEFYSLIDLSPNVIEVNKVVGASFAINKNKFSEKMFFDENLGRKDGVLIGGEETDLCSRIKDSGGKIIYTPNTFAYHIVSRSRINLLWLLRRSYYGGVSRGLKTKKIDPFNKKRKLVDYFGIIIIIFPYYLGYITSKIKKLNG